jgi:bile acid:Na+ symporter, BASS family
LEDDVEAIPAYINVLNYLFVAIYMFSVPLETTRGAISQTLGDLNLIGRALLANFVIIPILGFVIAYCLDLPPLIRTGFLLLVMAPGGLLALQFARISNGNRVFAAALLFVFCLLAIFITPLFVYLFFPREGEGRLPFGWLTMMLLLLVVAPLIVGRVLQKLIPDQAPTLGLWLGRLSIVIFIIAAVTAGRYKSPAIKLMGTNGIAAIVVLILGAWAVGWLLGGPEIRNRKVLAISSSMRNIGVCLPIASNYFTGTEVTVPMLAFSGIMIPMNMVLSLVLGRMLRDPTDTQKTPNT